MNCSFCNASDCPVVTGTTTTCICDGCAMECVELLRAHRAGEAVKAYGEKIGRCIVDPPEVKRWPSHTDLLKRAG